jgi:hypothetical protein
MSLLWMSLGSGLCLTEPSLASRRSGRSLTKHWRPGKGAACVAGCP